MRWRPGQYEKFSGPRLQPGLDLLSRLPEIDAKRVIDLGCGTGELTSLLAQRYPGARTIGLDSSEQMLESARGRYPELEWVREDLRDFAPPEKVEVLFSNAALHWVPDHRDVFPRLLSLLSPRGVLAVQMPRNFEAPSHRLVREVAELPRFRGQVSLSHEAVLTPAGYYDLLAPLSSSVELWETEYLHALTGEDPVLEWVRATTLLPVERALPADDFAAFVEEYRARLRVAYPRREDGVTLFPFRRIFVLIKAGR